MLPFQLFEQLSRTRVVGWGISAIAFESFRAAVEVHRVCPSQWSTLWNVVHAVDMHVVAKARKPKDDAANGDDGPAPA